MLVSLVKGRPGILPVGLVGGWVAAYVHVLALLLGYFVRSAGMGSLSVAAMGSLSVAAMGSLSDPRLWENLRFCV